MKQDRFVRARRVDRRLRQLSEMREQGILGFLSSIRGESKRSPPFGRASDTLTARRVTIRPGSRAPRPTADFAGDSQGHRGDPGFFDSARRQRYGLMTKPRSRNQKSILNFIAMQTLDKFGKHLIR